MNLYDFKIPYLISRYKCGKISDTERRELDAWIAADPENARIFEHTVNTSVREKYSQYASIDRDAAWEGMGGKPGQKGRRPTKHKKLWISVAAAVVVVGIFLGLNREWLMPEPVIAIEKIEPGGKKAILTLDDGSQVVIDHTGSDIIKQDKATVKLADGELVYEDVDSAAINVYNAITVPRGGEHKLTLPDGTQIWLNSDSYIRYPMLFSGGERRVLLRGEAYFDVAPNPEIPFIVETENQTLEVLGTEFNVCAYQDAPHTVTTLVNGRVSITGRHEQGNVVLQPGEQSTIDAGSSPITVSRVNISDFTSWRDGLINIQNNTLEQVLAKMSRWYDVDFIISDPEVENIVFEGDIPKNSNLLSVINMLEAAGEIKFIAKPDVIEIKKK